MNNTWKLLRAREGQLSSVAGGLLDAQGYCTDGGRLTPSQCDQGLFFHATDPRKFLEC